MVHLEKRNHQLPWHALLCTAVLLIFTVVWSAQSVFASDLEVVGRVERMPSAGLIGEWTVAGFDFVTNSATELRQERSGFAVGRCVEVEYVAVAAQNVATKLATKSEDDCGSESEPTITEPDETSTPEPSETPDATPEPTATHEGDDDGDGDGDGEHEGDHDRDGLKIRAIVEAKPEGSFRGVWTIGGSQFEVGMQTRIRQKDGPLREGACVEVRFTGDAEPYTVVYMETERRSQCTRHPGGTIPQPTSTPTDDDHEIYGTLNRFPAEMIGEWVINGKSYTATAETEFEQEHGVFEEGACVKAHLATSDSSVLREVETTSPFRCGGSDDSGSNARGRLFGKIQEFPAELIGPWQIGGTTVVADAATKFNQRRAAFDKDVMVSVRFIVLEDGTFYATEIESKFSCDDDGDNDHNDVFEGAEGHAYGLIEKLPSSADLIGEWVVAGITYTVTSDTRFVKPHSNFAVGVMVRVKYRIDENGNLVARQIKTTRGNGGSSSHDHATLFGFVDTMPTSGYVGEWMVDGILFEATEKTKFKEEHGLFAIGSYVKMEYYTVDGRNFLHEIESEVPPGAGDNAALGEIEVIEEEGTDSGFVSASAVNATVWTIGGRQYVVTAATDLNDFQGELAVGQDAYVNSYTADDGSEVATQIQGVVLDHHLFLPAVNR